MNWKPYIKYIAFGVLALIFIIWIICSQVKCNKLQKQLNEEKIKNLEYVDSLTYINREHQRLIDKYESEIVDLESAIDSLTKVKQKIIIKKDEVIVSKDVSSAVKLLRENLEKCEN